MPTKVHIVKAVVFPVVMYRCDTWAIKKAECQRIDAFELWCWRTLENLFDYKINPVNPKGNQFWIFIGKTDAEAEAPILWPSDSKSWLIRKEPNAEKDWRQKEEGTTEDEMAGWHHQPMDISLSKLRRWWKTRKPGMLQSVQSQILRHKWATEQQQKDKETLFLWTLMLKLISLQLILRYPQIVVTVLKFCWLNLHLEPIYN